MRSGLGSNSKCGSELGRIKLVGGGGGGGTKRS